MKNIKKSLNIFPSSGILIVAASLTACEDVITLELEKSEPQIVIESLITDDQGPVTVKITKSQDFYNPGEIQSVDFAQVTISDNIGNTDTLTIQNNGIYQSVKIKGNSGSTYHLNIIAEENEYTAVSSLPEKVTIDSLYYNWGENPHSEGYMVNLCFRDPKEIKNYYRIKLMINNQPYEDKKSGNEYILWDDKIWDGNKVDMPVKRGGSFFDIGDTVTVQLQSLGEETYNYYNTLRNALVIEPSMMSMGKGLMEGSAAPANPVTNLSGNALGYFGTAAISSKTIIIK
jgi:hypothetical protein